MARGAAIHKLAERFIIDELVALPPELKRFSRLFRWLRRQYRRPINGMTVEESWAFTKEWEQTAWNDWDRCWLRIKLDCAYHSEPATLVVIDWKTGKFREQDTQTYQEQLELYALGALLTHEHVETVRPMLVYLDNGLIWPGDNEQLVFTRADLSQLQRSWELRTRPLLQDTTFAPRPNNLCRFCFYRAANKANGGGQCRF